MKCYATISAGALALGVVLGAVGVFPESATAQTAAPLASDRAAIRSATFLIANMNCALCPLTVRTAMEHVAGVRSVEVDFDSKTALVTFDPSLTDVEAIAAASANAGYPAEPSG